MALRGWGPGGADQDLGGLPRILAPGYLQPPEHLRDQEEDEPRTHDQ